MATYNIRITAEIVLETTIEAEDWAAACDIARLELKQQGELSDVRVREMRDLKAGGEDNGGSVRPYLDHA